MDNPQTPPQRPPSHPPENGVPPGAADDDLYAGTGGPDPVEDWSARYGEGAQPPPPPPGGGLDFAALFALVDALRSALPADLQARATGLIREALLTLRSLIDWYLERLDNRPQEPKVEDIPID
jgi:hypothetical protein